jgi:hypothetical protein
MGRHYIISTFTAPRAAAQAAALAATAPAAVTPFHFDLRNPLSLGGVHHPFPRTFLPTDGPNFSDLRLPSPTFGPSPTPCPRGVVSPSRRCGEGLAASFFAAPPRGGVPCNRRRVDYTTMYVTVPLRLIALLRRRLRRSLHSTPPPPRSLNRFPSYADSKDVIAARILLPGSCRRRDHHRFPPLPRFYVAGYTIPSLTHPQNYSYLLYLAVYHFTVHSIAICGTVTPLPLPYPVPCHRGACYHCKIEFCTIPPRHPASSTPAVTEPPTYPAAREDADRQLILTDLPPQPDARRSASAEDSLPTPE